MVRPRHIYSFVLLSSFGSVCLPAVYLSGVELSPFITSQNNLNTSLES